MLTASLFLNLLTIVLSRIGVQSVSRLIVVDLVAPALQTIVLSLFDYRGAVSLRAV